MGQYISGGVGQPGMVWYGMVGRPVWYGMVWYGGAAGVVWYGMLGHHTPVISE